MTQFRDSYQLMMMDYAFKRDFNEYPSVSFSYNSTAATAISLVISSIIAVVNENLEDKRAIITMELIIVISIGDFTTKIINYYDFNKHLMVTVMKFIIMY